MEVDSSELAEYICEVLKGVSKGVGADFVVMEPIKLEIATVNEIEAEGNVGIKVHIFGAGGKLNGAVTNEQTSKVVIAVSPKITEKQLKDRQFVITKMGLQKR